MRLWGRACLSIARVRLEVAGEHHLRGRQKRVVVFNHTSMLDLFILCACLPEGGVPAIKREILYFPFLGWVVLVLRFVVIDRGNRDKARASIDRAAVRLRRERITVLIAPEGTRTRDGSLGKFKLGPLHLAREAEAPIFPVVIRGAYELMPYGVLHCRAGTVKVDVLGPVPELPRQDVHAAAEELRGVFVRALGMA